MSLSQQTIAILFADIVDSTRLYAQVGDAEAHRRVAESLEYMAEAIDAYGGKVLRTVGDATLASFDHCDHALLAACKMQELHRSSPLSVRVGFHYGSVIPDRGDVYGNAVNIAARVASYAKSDEITTTEHSVSCLTAEQLNLVVPLDVIKIKGLDAPVRVYRVEWDNQNGSRTQIVSPTFAEEPAMFESRFVKLIYRAKEYTVGQNQSSLTIGRGEDCQLVVLGDKVSRKHVRIEAQSGQVLLSDESTNGTYVIRNGHKPLFVRRETIVLEGSGQIGVGSLTDSDINAFLYFSVYAN